MGWGQRVRGHARDAEAYRAFEEFVDVPMLVLSLVFVPVVVAPLVAELTPVTLVVLEAVSWFIWAAFVVEYAAKLYLAPDRWRMVRTHVPDLLVMVLPLLRPLRAARGLRLVRPALGLLRAAMAAHRVFERPAFRGFLLVVGVVLLAGAGIAWSFEHDAPDGNIVTLADALWWAIVTTTTVGYGDRFPVTPEGRAVAVVLMVLGVSLLSVVTANIAAFFVEQGTEHDPRETELADLRERLDRIERLLREQVGTR